MFDKLSFLKWWILGKGPEVVKALTSYKRAKE